MKLIACLIWYEEDPEDLRRVAHSLKEFADGIVAFDGAFDRFPRGTANAWSPKEQLKALAEGCASAGIELLAYQPTEAGVWLDTRGNEVEKRNATFRAAGFLGADWVFNCDADMHLLHAEPDARDLIANTKLDVAVVDIEGKGQRCMFRWSPDLHYYRTHFIAKRGEVVLACPIPVQQREAAGLAEPVPALDLTTKVLFDHPRKRDFFRRTQQKEWYEIRDTEGIESL